MKILHMTLHKKWFDLIAAGIKTEEYRDIKPYWQKRLDNKTYDEIYFRNGYHKNAPWMRVEFKGCIQKDTQYVIKLGKVREIKNYENLHRMVSV